MARDTTRSYSLPDSVLGLGPDEDVFIIEGDFDPTIGAGQSAPIGSLFLRRDVPFLYMKDSAPDTGWSQLGSGSASFTNRLQTVYVGKHGSASPTSNGRVPDDPFLTFAAAITYVNTQSPANGNRWSIICEDGGTYIEGFTIPSWVFVKAPNATFTGNIILTDNSEFVFQEANAASGDVISKPAGTATGWATGEIVRATGTANALTNAATQSILIVRVRQVYTENGTGILDNSTGAGHIHMDVEDLYITGTGTGVDRGSNSGIIVGRISHILETGAGIGNGTALDITDGRMTINVGTIACATAYQVQGTGSLNLLVNEIDPGSARVQTSGSAEVNVIEADSLRWKNQNSSFTARRTEFVAIDTSGGVVTMNLPNPASNGDSVTFQDSQNTFTTNNLIVDAGTGGLIDDGAGGSQSIVIELSGTSGIFIYNETLGLWTFARIQEEVAFSPSNVIYVTKNGSDTIGDGSFSNPYLTVKKGATEALLVANVSNPTTVKVLDGIYDEVNPINVVGLNSEFVQVQGSETESTIIRPTVNGQPLFALTSNVEDDGPTLTRMTLQGQNNGGTDYRNVVGGSLIHISGNGMFNLEQMDTYAGRTSIDAGNGVISTSQTVNWNIGSASESFVNIDAKSSVHIVGNVISIGDALSVNIITNDTSSVDLSNYDLCGDTTQTTQAGTGLIANNSSRVFLNGGLIHHCILGSQFNNTSNVRIVATEFLSNTTDYDQVDGTAIVRIQGTLSKTKQLIADGANVSLNYIDSDSGDYIVGNANTTGDPGKEFRVRDFDGRIAIGDNATNANVATGGVGGSRTLNLIDTNGNMRIWRYVTDGNDPAVEWIKGINPANPNGFGDAPITAITAATDTITIDVSSADYGDPLTQGGIDRTSLAERAFPAGRLFRVNGTASNDGDYTVVSATYNSGPQTIDVVVTTNITVDEIIGTAVFGGGAGRTDGVSTFVGDPAGAVSAGVGNVWWDMFLQEQNYFVIRNRTGGGGGPLNEKVRVFTDHSEWLGSTNAEDTDNATILYLQTNAGATNYLEIDNAATANGPELIAAGTDTNIDIEMIPKGTGTVIVPAGYEANIGTNSLITQSYAAANFSPIKQSFHAHNGVTTQTLTTAFVTAIIGTDIRSDAIYSNVSGEVTVNRTGEFSIVYEITGDSTGSRSTVECVLQVNGVDVPGTFAYTYNRNTANGEGTGGATSLVSLTTGDVVRVRIREVAGAAITAPNASRLTIQEID